MTADNERELRYHVGNLNVVYDTGDGFWSGRVADVSASGLFVETHHELPEGTEVTLMPDTPDDEALPFELRAVVVRTNEYDLDNHWDRTPGIAFRWVGLDSEQLEQIREFLKAHGATVR